MSIKHRTETPNIPYGPATGVPTPEPHNEALSTGPDHEYSKDCTPALQIMQSRDTCRADQDIRSAITSKGDL